MSVIQVLPERLKSLLHESDSGTEKAVPFQSGWITVFPKLP